MYRSFDVSSLCFLVLFSLRTSVRHRAGWLPCHAAEKFAKAEIRQGIPPWKAIYTISIWSNADPRRWSLQLQNFFCVPRCAKNKVREREIIQHFTCQFKCMYVCMCMCVYIIYIYIHMCIYSYIHIYSIYMYYIYIYTQCM